MNMKRKICGLVNKTRKINLMKEIICSACILAIWAAVTAHAAAPAIDNIAMVPRLTIQSDPATTDTIQYSTDLNQTNWVALTNLVVAVSPYWFVDVNAPPSPQRFYRVVAFPTPSGMALIPAGSFSMGDTLDHEADALPTHQVTVSAFYMDTKLVTYGLWQQVYQWATTNGYTFDNPGLGKAANHPVHTVNWYDAVKWCNARSQWMASRPAISPAQPRQTSTAPARSTSATPS